MMPFFAVIAGAFWLMGYGMGLGKPNPTYRVRLSVGKVNEVRE